MSTADSRLGVMPGFRTRRRVKFFHIAQLRRFCECEQVAAVCYRITERGIEFLLVQTRKGRWTFPKGKAEPGLTHAQTAALEAFEEAGVHGRMEEASFGRYSRQRPPDGRKSRKRRIAVSAHLCQVLGLEKPSESKRNPKWFAAEDAKRRLREDRATADGAELARILTRAAARVQRLQTLRALPERPQLAPLGLEVKRGELQPVRLAIVGKALRTTARTKVSLAGGKGTQGDFPMKPLLLRGRSHF